MGQDASKFELLPSVSSGASMPSVDLETLEAPAYPKAYQGVYQDMDQPLAHYFVSSSHNTYLSGNQVAGKGGTKIIKSCLRAGCRVVELDVYDEEGGQALAGKGPQVKHGGAWITAVSLEDCIQAVKDCAFDTNPYPVIITLENHCNAQNQVRVGRIIQAVLGDLLFVPEDEDVWLHASPNQLKGKILLRAKVKEGTAPELAKLVYLRNTKLKRMLSDKDFLSGKAVTCSMEAGKYDELARRSAHVVKFTSKHILRIYPQAWRISSRNYDPQRFWNLGAQLVALNWQHWDRRMWMYTTKFSDNGNCGYVLKPSWMIAGEDPPQRPPATLVVNISSAHREFDSHDFGGTAREDEPNRDKDMYVKVQLRGMAIDKCSKTTQMIRDVHGKVCFFNKRLKFKVHYPEMALLVFQLRDKDRSSREDILGYCGVNVNTLAPGHYKLGLKLPSTGEDIVGKGGTPMRWIAVKLAWDSASDDVGYLPACFIDGNAGLERKDTGHLVTPRQ